jgi:RHS repeat-associated protein
MTQRTISWNAPYTFSAKEKDVETGYGYFGARYYDSGLSIWLSVDPMSDKYPSMSPYVYCANNPVMLVDPDGRDWYEAEDGSKTWKEGNDATIEQNGVKYKNIGTSTTISYMDGKYDIKFEQNSPIELTEHVLKNDDYRTQMNSDGTKKAGEAGNCFYQAGQMVESSGATSLNGTANNISNRQDGVNYINSQIDNGKSVRVQVDRTADGKGDHWVAISSRTTNLRTNQVISYGFFDPATSRTSKGVNNSFSISNFNLSGRPSYNSRLLYNVVNVRKNR